MALADKHSSSMVVDATVRLLKQLHQLKDQDEVNDDLIDAWREYEARLAKSLLGVAQRMAGRAEFIYP